MTAQHIKTPTDAAEAAVSPTYPVQSPARSSTYTSAASNPEATPRTVPLGVDVLAGESVDSWIEMLGRRHGVSIQQMLSALGLGAMPYRTHKLLDGVAPARWRAVESAAGLAPGQLHSAVGNSIGIIERLPSKGSRFCPQCLAENEGRWMLAWRLPWTAACPRHRLLLHDVCPRCLTSPRRTLTGGTGPVGPATCPHAARSTRKRCGADLTQADYVEVDTEILLTQQWIDHLLTRIRSEPRDELDRESDARASAGAVLHDLPVLVAWLIQQRTSQILDAAQQLTHTHSTTERRTDHDTPRCWQRPDAATTAAALTRLRTVLDHDDAESIQTIREIVAQRTSRHRAIPPKMPPRQWNALRTSFPDRYLQAIDTRLVGTERLRMRTPTAAAERVRSDDGQSDRRARMLPALLWPDWSARLLPVSGISPEKLRRMLAASLLFPGRLRRYDNLKPHTGSSISLMAFGTLFSKFVCVADSSALTSVLAVLCRIATYLDEVGSPIDYQRRRACITAETINWSDWRDLSCAAGAHPGEQGPAGRHLHARRYLHQLLSGSDLDDKRHLLAFRGDRAAYSVFVESMTPALRWALQRHATDLLSGLDIDEPVYWTPPATLADGLTLPGVDPDTLDLSTLQRLVIGEGRPLGEVAVQMGVHLEHVRVAVEQLQRPERNWRKSAAPIVWQREQRAARLLTYEFFRREYVQGGRRLAELSAETGLDRATVSRYAKMRGIKLAQAATPRPVDVKWLRKQYCDARRSTADIATELGISATTLAARLRAAGIQARPQGVHSRTEMIASLGRAPIDIRKAVEGGLSGWQRLRRFQIAIQFPSLDTAAPHLRTHPTALYNQFGRLERDVGKPLFDRASTGQPQRPTSYGRKLLRQLDSPRIAAMMKNAHGRRFYPEPPDAATLERTTAEFTRVRTRRPGPLKQFHEIPVQRFRLTRPFLVLLQYLVDRPAIPFYGLEVNKDVGIDMGTLYPLLKRLEHAGWLTSWPEDEQEWLAGAPPGRGPGRRRVYYALTPAGQRAAEHELATPSARCGKRKPGDMSKMNC